MNTSKPRWYELEPADAAMAKQAYDAWKVAEARWIQVDKHLKHKYGATSANEVSSMEYSIDFRFLLKSAGVTGCSAESQACSGSVQ